MADKQMEHKFFFVKVPVDPDDFDSKATKEIKLEVKVPTLKQTHEAQMAYNRGLDQAIRSKAPLRIEVEKLLKERKIWTDDVEKEFKEQQVELAKLVNKLKQGGKLTEARQTAIDIRKKRSELANLNGPRRILDLSTAEAQAEVARFNYYVVECVVYPDGRKFFENVDDYLEKGNKDYALECAKQFSIVQYGLDADTEKKLPENQFLLKYKFIRPDLKLIDRDNNLIDEDGNYIDEENRVLDGPHGKPVDHAGKPIDDSFVPTYLDEDGNPVRVDELIATA